MSRIIYCLTCSKETKNNKFCSQSCSTKFNNIGVRRHGKPKPKNFCIVCNQETQNPKYCSNKCQGSIRKLPKEHRLSVNKNRQARYRAKKLRKIHPSANPEKIREIYKMCPKGYEVDHIVPLSLGGWHHEDNLQYLTIEQNRTKSNRYIG